MNNIWGDKNPAAVKAYFDEVGSYRGFQALELIIKPELIGISTLSFVDGYTTYSCSGHIEKEGNIGFSISPPKIDFAYSDTERDACEFHQRICSIEVEYDDKRHRFRAPPATPKDRILTIFGVPDINDIESGKSYGYMLCGENLGTHDYTCVTALEDFWIQFSEILADFTDPETYEARHEDFLHVIRDGKLYTPFSHKPNHGIDITGKIHPTKRYIIEASPFI